jgi:hypothetical protein
METTMTDLAAPLQRYSSAELDAFASDFDRDSYVILKRHIDRATIAQWLAAFRPLLEKHWRDSGEQGNRGPGRHYLTLPFQAPFADPGVFCDPDVLGVVERVAGRDPVMCQLATDTPVRGSDYQDIHRDTPALFENFPETPSFQIAVNIPLVDVTAENGPFETTLGTHRMLRGDAVAALERGEIKLEALTMGAGDVMIRDVRALHRGTPNRSDTPRPMVVIGYSRSWYFRPEVHIDVPNDVYAALPPRAQRLLRHNPRVDSPQVPSGETYQQFAY